MKQRLYIILLLLLVGAVLIGLNAASYVQKPQAEDNEFNPNRSSFNPGATGTLAYYSLLNETGRKVVRWQDAPGALLTAKTNVPSVFIVTGALRRQFTEGDLADMLRWVSNGGRLVVIDRYPPEGLLKTTSNWTIKADEPGSLSPFVDPTDQQQMTKSVAAVKPVQPTLFTRQVNAVQPSVFAASISFEPDNEPKKFGLSNRNSRSKLAGDDDDEDPPPPPPMAKPRPTPASGGNGIGTGTGGDSEVPAPSKSAPVVHFANGEKNLLVDVPYGEGRIVFLADPYIVSNAGLAVADNAQLAVNLASAGAFTVAFDEYHQGYGHDSNRFLQFFEGTPVVAIFFQCIVIVGLVFFSQSRRFARAVPEPEPDRLSKLEYVTAMAELQGRTRAFDLAVENIYTDFRRRVCRLLGLDAMSAKSGDIARAIAERSGLDASRTNETLFACEEIVRGEPTDKREVLRLVGELRAIEEKLGMTRRPRVGA